LCSIDTQKQEVCAESAYIHKDTEQSEPYRPKMTIPYEELVVAVGAHSNTFGIPGVSQYCFFLKQLSDARSIRNRVIECFERASSPASSESERQRLLHFMVIGGGPTSVEFTAELHDFLKQDVHKWYPDLENLVKITLVEAGKTLLSSFDSNLSEYTMKLFKKRDIDVRTGVAVKEVRRHEMVLSDGTEIPFGMAVWSTGVSANPFVKSLPFAKDRAERLLVDQYLRVKGHENIYAVGDCACIEGIPLPQTAQAAEQMGKYLGNYLNAKSYHKEKDLKIFQFQNFGMLAYVGGHQALVDSPYAKNRGFAAWLFWNAAYVTKLVSLKNKIMIPMYWFKSFLFGRDISRF